MSRVIAGLACGFMLSACSSVSWMPSMPSMDWGATSAAQFSLSVESDPPGAEARAATGSACKTPCNLMVDARGNIAVNVSLAGYLPQSVPISLIPAEDPRFGSESSTARLDPNPVFVVLERVPPPPPPAKKKSVKKRVSAVTAPRPAAATSAAPAPAATPEAQPATTGNAPWPMPR
jgi:hypothetical protein